MIKRRVLIVIPSYKSLNIFSSYFINNYRKVKFSKERTAMNIETETMFVEIVNERILETQNLRGKRYDTVFLDDECDMTKKDILMSVLVPMFASIDTKRAWGIYTYCSMDTLEGLISQLEVLY